MNPHSHTAHTPASLADVLEKDYFPMPTNGASLYLAEGEWRMVIAALRAELTVPAGPDRSSVLEEAARACDAASNGYYGDTRVAMRLTSRDIRALKNTAPQPPQGSVGDGGPSEGNRPQPAGAVSYQPVPTNPYDDDHAASFPVNAPAAEVPEAGPADSETPEELRMVIGYLVGELQIAGDHRSTPEIVFNAVSAVKRSSATEGTGK